MKLSAITLTIMSLVYCDQIVADFCRVTPLISASTTQPQQGYESFTVGATMATTWRA